MTNEEYTEYLQSDKWKSIAKRRMEIDGNRCVMCNSKGTTANPLECHHLSYKWLGNEEERIYQDLVTLCHACHKQVHALMCRKTDPNGRHGWKANYTVPAVSVYTLTGKELESREVGKL